MEQKKRIRRTNAEVENAISAAMEKLVEKHGLLNVTANMLIAEAGIEMVVFTKRYGSIDDLIFEYVTNNDYWIAGRLPFKDISKLGPEEYYLQTLLRMAENLEKSMTARDELTWELRSTSEAAKNAAELKEMENEGLLSYYTKLFKDSGTDIRGMTALLIAGIYYMYLHKDKSTFCGIDLNTRNGRSGFVKLIRLIVGKLFAGIQDGYVDSRTIETARRMNEKGIDKKTISDILEISEDDLDSILAE